MAIASLAFGTPDPIPAPPVAGKKLFLGADGKLKTIAPDGTVERVGGASDWADIENKPSTFPPSAHTHAISEVTGLTDALAGKATSAQGAKADTALQPEVVDYRGLYDNGADYFPGQVVSYNDSLYVRVGEPNPGYPPGTSYWAAFEPAASPAFKLWVEVTKANTAHTHTSDKITDFVTAVNDAITGLDAGTY